MGENSQKIGKKLESLGVQLLEMFNWSRKMGDKEIKCTRTIHKNAKGTDKRTHGIDLYMEYYDPYICGIQGVFIECKNRQWQSIGKSQIQDWVNEEINLMECAKHDSSLNEFYGDGADKNCALILINCTDGKYDHKEFLNYLSEISVPQKRNPYKIFIAGNRQIEKWDAIDRIIKEKYKDKLSVIYPSINNSQPISAQYWSINQLFSKYIFCETTEEVAVNRGTTTTNKILVIFFLDTICAESFQYMWSMVRFFQYESHYDGFEICFWTDKAEDHDYINENFDSIIKNYCNGNVSEQVVGNIKKFCLLNRHLGPIDNR